MVTYPGMENDSLVALRAEAGTAALPGPSGSVQVPFWGFRSRNATDGVPQIPGPVFEVTEGARVFVNLENGLAEPVSIVFPGQEAVPQPVKDGSGRFLSYTSPAEPGNAVVYTFRAVRPGTFLYESGTQPEKQVLMGLYGAMIVRPWNFNPNRSATRTVYGSYNTRYDVERVLVLADVDTKLSQIVAGGGPFDLSTYAPDFWTINGRCYPATLDPDDTSSQPYGASISARTGETVLLRLVNAGFHPHNLCFGGLYGVVIAVDGHPLRTAVRDTSYQRTALALAPGQTCDVLLRPATAGEYYLYDQALLHSLTSGMFPGGMMTRLIVS